MCTMLYVFCISACNQEVCNIIWPFIFLTVCHHIKIKFRWEIVHIEMFCNLIEYWICHFCTKAQILRWNTIGTFVYFNILWKLCFTSKMQMIKLIFLVHTCLNIKSFWKKQSGLFAKYFLKTEKKLGCTSVRCSCKYSCGSGDILSNLNVRYQRNVFDSHMRSWSWGVSLKNWVVSFGFCLLL